MDTPKNGTDLLKIPIPELFGKLNEQINGNDTARNVVTAYVARTHGVHTLPAFVTTDEIPDDKKRLTLLRCLVAVKQDKLDSLNPVAVKPAINRDALAERAVTVPLNLPAKEKDTIDMPPKPKPAEPQPDALTAAAAFIESIRKGINATLDEQKVISLIKEHAPQPKEPEKPEAVDVEALTDAIMGKVNTALAGISKPLVVSVNNVESKPVEGAKHWQFMQVLTWINSGAQLWLHGGSGNGKTHLIYQIAEALNVRPWVISMDETMTVGRLVGYMSATGGFVEGLAYRGFRDGGLVVFDEADLTCVALAAVNAMTANGHFLFPNGELVKRHENCRFVCLANSKGTGAVAGYVARVRMDAATLDRFACVEFHIDEALERTLATGVHCPSNKTWEPQPRDEQQASLAVGRWVDYVQAARAKAGSTVLISQRCGVNGAKAIRAGIPMKEVADALLFKLMADDTRRNIIRSIGEVPNE